MDAEDSTADGGAGAGAGDDQDTAIAPIQEICVAAVKAEGSAQGRVSRTIEEEEEESAWRTIVEEVKRITQANRSRLLAAKSAELLSAIWKICGPMSAQSRVLTDLVHYICGVLLTLAPQPVNGKDVILSKECAGITGDTARAMRQRLLEMVENFVSKYMGESSKADVENGSLLTLSAIGVSPFPTPIQSATCSAGGLYLASLPMGDRLCAIRAMEGLLRSFAYDVSPERLDAFALGISSFLSVERSPQCIIPCLKAAQYLLCDKRLGETTKSELFDVAGSFFPVAIAGSTDEIQVSEEAIHLQSSLIAELERTLTISAELANSFRSTAIESLMDQSWERASQGWSLIGAMASKYGESCRLGLEDILDLTQSALRGLESHRLPSIGEVLAIVCRGALASKEHELLQGLMSQCYERITETAGNWRELAGLCRPVAKSIASSKGTGHAFAALFSNLEQFLRPDDATEKHMFAFNLIHAVLGYPRGAPQKLNQDFALLAERLSYYSQASLSGSLDSAIVQSTQETILACLAGIALLPGSGSCHEPTVNVLIDILKHKKAPGSALAAFESFVRTLFLEVNSNPDLEIPSRLFEFQDDADLAAVISRYGPSKLRASALTHLVNTVVANSNGSSSSSNSSRIKALLILSRYSLAPEETPLVESLSETVAQMIKTLLSIHDYSQSEAVALIECVCACVRFMYNAKADLEKLRLDIWRLVMRSEDLSDISLVAAVAALSTIGRSVTATDEDIERLSCLLEKESQVGNGQFGKIRSTVFQSAGSSVLTAIQQTQPLENLGKWKLIKPLTLLRACRLVAIGGGNPEPLIHRAIERICQSDSVGIDEICSAAALALIGSNHHKDKDDDGDGGGGGGDDNDVNCGGLLWSLTSLEERQKKLQLQRCAMSLFSALDQVLCSSSSASLLRSEPFCAFCTLVMCYAPKSALRLLKPDFQTRMAPFSSKGLGSVSLVDEFPDDTMVLTTVITNIVERTRWSSAEIANDILSALLLVITQGRGQKESVVIAAVQALADLLNKSTIRRYPSDDEFPHSWISERRQEVSEAMRSLLDDERRSVRAGAIEGLTKWENQ